MSDTFVGIQIGAISFVDEGVEQVLDMLYSDYDIYREVLVGGQNPTEAVNIFTELVNEKHNVAQPKN